MAVIRWAIVTGATGAIGAAIARRLAANPEWGVVLAVRRSDRGEALASELGRVTKNPNLRVEVVDLSRHASVKELAARWRGPLDVLVNNAAVAPPSRQVTPEGLELQFATNVLSGLWMTFELRGALREGTQPCVVNVASYWAGDLDLTDLCFERRRYDNNLAYRQSKQMNRMVTVALAAELAADQIRVHACHPGDVPSKLASDLGFGGAESPDSAADTPSRLALGELGADSTGGYFEHGQRVRCRFGEDQPQVRALWAALQAFV